MIVFRLVIASFLARAFLSLPVAAETLVGRIIGVADGDTLTLLDSSKQSYKIRLSGIDAPEKKQGFGQQSKLSLSNLAYGHQAIAECPKRDRYQRAVCVVTVAGKDVGLQQIHQGLAWWYRDYAHEQRAQDQRDYERAEQAAQGRRVGLWRENDPTRPWEWRRERREHSAAKRQGKSMCVFHPKQPPIPIETLPLIPIPSRPGVPLNTRQWAFAVAGWSVMGYNVAH